MSSAKATQVSNDNASRDPGSFAGIDYRPLDASKAIIRLSLSAVVLLVAAVASQLLHNKHDPLFTATILWLSTVTCGVLLGCCILVVLLPFLVSKDRRRSLRYLVASTSVWPAIILSLAFLLADSSPFPRIVHAEDSIGVVMPDSRSLLAIPVSLFAALWWLWLVVAAFTRMRRSELSSVPTKGDSADPMRGRQR
jgi:hypothetical protein